MTEKEDIVARLRTAYSINDSSAAAHMGLEAADEIERLRRELESALSPVSRTYSD